MRTDDPIDVIEQAVVALSKPGLLPAAQLQDELAAWLAESADEAREHEALLGEVHFPTPRALLSVTYRKPVAAARAVLELAAA